MMREFLTEAELQEAECRVGEPFRFIEHTRRGKGIIAGIEPLREPPDQRRARVDDYIAAVMWPNIKYRAEFAAFDRSGSCES